MAPSFVYTGLALLVALLATPQALADREHRRHEHRLQGYDQPYSLYRQHGYRHHRERRHKGYRHYRQHQHYRHGTRIREAKRHGNLAPYRYAPPRHHHRPGISVVLPLGHFIRELPGGYIRLHVNGTSYYYQGGHYYRAYQRGYRVVTPPGR